MELQLQKFLAQYAERKLGRALSSSESLQIKDMSTRRSVRDWAASLSEVKPKVVEEVKPKKEIKSKKESVKVEQSVINSRIKKEKDTSSE